MVDERPARNFNYQITNTVFLHKPKSYTYQLNTAFTMKEDVRYDKTCHQIVQLFSELENIVLNIEHDFAAEHKQDPQLRIEIVKDRLQMVSLYKNLFLDYIDRVKRDWSLQKYVEQSIGNLSSFFRGFDNPFLGSTKWTVKIDEILNALSKEWDALEALVKHLSSEGKA